MAAPDIRPRWRKVFSDLWDNKVRTLLVVASISIGVFAVGVVLGTYLILASDMNASYADANPANIQLSADPFDKDLPKVIERVPGVRVAEGRQSLNVRLKISETDFRVLNLVALPDFNNPRVGLLLLQQGTLQPADHQLVLERHAADKLGVKVGDSLNIELSDGTKKVMPVTGIIIDRTMGYKSFQGVYEAFITFNTLEWLHQPLLFNQLFVTVSGDPNNTTYIKTVADGVTKMLERGGRKVYHLEMFQRDKHPLDSIVKALLGVLLILGVLVVFLSGSLIANTLSALLNQHFRQIGVMKLIGARRYQIVTLYVLLILAFGAISLLIAIPAASWATVALAGMIADLLNVVLRPHTIIPLAVIVQVVIALFVPLITGISPVLSGVRITVQKAVSGSNMEESVLKKDVVDRMLHNLRGVQRPLLISLRNTFRRKRRLALTLFNLTLGGAIFISVFNVQVALNKKIDQTVKYFRADVNLDFNESYRLEKVNDLAMTIPGVKRVEGWLVTTGELKSPANTTEYATMFGLPAQSDLVTPIMIKGRWLLPGDENAITLNEMITEKFPGLQVGDHLSIKINGTERDWQLVGIFQYTGMDSLFAYTNYPYLASILQTPDRASSYKIVTTDHTAVLQEQTREQVDQLFKKAGFNINKVDAGSTLTGSVTSYINILIYFLLIMAVMTALVGSIGLAGTLSMNVMERTREIGIMRAIGAYDRIVMSLVIVEGLVISSISYVLGAALSFPITSLLSNVVSQAIFRSPADFAFTSAGFFLWLGIVLVLSAVASIIPARSASKMTIREVLSYE